MGLFTQQPEDPAEWAGLPSEPLRPETDAERLRDAGGADPASLIGMRDEGVRSVGIPLDAAPAVEGSAHH